MEVKQQVDHSYKRMCVVCTRAASKMGADVCSFMTAVGR